MEPCCFGRNDNGRYYLQRVGIASEISCRLLFSINGCN